MFLSALVFVLLLVSGGAALAAIVVPQSAAVSRFVAWYALAAACALRFVAGVGLR